jgi:hypothetical protein
MSAHGEHFGAFIRRDPSLLSSLVFVTVACAIAYAERNHALAVYLLSFWHYGVYALAFYFGAVALPVFKRDAVVLKTVSLLALGSAYLAEPLNALSLAVIGAGFGLNILAARALGSDRTYYGHELAGLPHRRITAFPYSWTAHPMLFGNMAAFGGTLINAEFCRQWWPLACTHVALNLALLAMECLVRPQRRGSAPPGEPPAAHPSGARIAWGIAVLVAAAASAWALWGEWSLTAAMLLAAMLGQGLVIYFSYSLPTMPAGGQRHFQGETP